MHIVGIEKKPDVSFFLQRILEHTDPGHQDAPLLRKAEKTMHELALKISSIQKETMEQDNRQKVSYIFKFYLPVYNAHLVSIHGMFLCWLCLVNI